MCAVTEHAHTPTEKASWVQTLLDAGGALAVIPMPRIGAEPPRELRVFKWGANPTTKGVKYLKPEGAQALMARYRERGVVKCFDYFHATYDPMATGEAKKAAGQFRPELRHDGLWFTDIQWTPKAAQGIRDGEWPYVSPAIITTKTGEIIDLRNAGLVTDPGTIGATPTILDGLLPKEAMDAKKKLGLEAYAASQSLLRCMQSLADTDGVEKDIGNMGIGYVVPLMDKLKAQFGGDIMEAATAEASKMAAGAKMMSTLSDVCGGESDPDKLIGLVLAKMTPAPAAAPKIDGVLLSDADASATKAMLLDAHRSRYATSQRAHLESQSLATVITYLSNAAEVVPSEAPREAAPTAPTTEGLKAAMDQAPIKAAAPASSDKPTTLAACTPQQRALVEGFLDIARQTQGDKFDEASAVQDALTCLSDVEPVTTNEIRHMPYGADQPNAMMLGEA